MMKLLKETYDNALSRQQKKAMGSRPRALSLAEKEECGKVAKKIVCEIGITMYQFNKWLGIRYKKTAENEAIRQAVEHGKTLGLLDWGNPIRYDSDKGLQRQNIIFTNTGLEKMFDAGFNYAITTVHATFAADPRRKY